MVVDLAFDLVFGLPWLTAANPRLDWVQRKCAVRVKSRWVELPVIAEETKNGKAMEQFPASYGK